MWRKYLGHLPESDHLYDYLKYDIQPLTGRTPRRPTYRVFELNGSNAVYLYEEKHSGARVIGKFFLSDRGLDWNTASRRLDREYSNLCIMRGRGFTGWPHYIARPLGRNDSLNKLLVTEFCYGELLSSVLSRALRFHDDALLYSKLTALAYFLACFHNRTASGDRVDFNDACNYEDGLIARLLHIGVIDWNEACEFYCLRDRWREQPKMWEDCRALVHGDATPENFMFGDGLSVISFDLERVKAADRIFDTGRIAGELAHFFMQSTGNRYAAEPFIGHFLWEYACHFPDRERTFETTTRRVPFYMGITLLRIARNDWLSYDYKRKLIHEAKQCLRRFSS